MEKSHPHVGATYRVVSIADDQFGVEVIVPDTYPTMVSGLKSFDAANAWIIGHQERVNAAPGLRWVAALAEANRCGKEKQPLRSTWKLSTADPAPLRMQPL